MTERADKPLFFECTNPNCGWYHRVGYNGPCDDPEARYDLGLLDETYGEAGWHEADAPVLSSRTGSVAPNLYRLQQLTPDVDLNGNKLEVGCKVRYYLSGHYMPDGDVIAGLAVTETSGACIDGILEELDVERDGRHCYKIKCVSEDLPEYDKRLLNQSGELKIINRVRRPSHPNDYLYPVHNGTPSKSVGVPAKTFQGIAISPDQTCPHFKVFRL
jgi:hypothetical protein